MVELVSRHTTLSGPRIHYRVGGRGPAVVVVNGWSLSGLMWPTSFLEGLTEQLTVIALCNRGTGGSERVERPFTFQDLAADVRAVLDAEHTDRAHLVGVSLGGSIAYTFALDYPSRLERLVLLASAPPLPAFYGRPPQAAADAADWKDRLWAAGRGRPEAEFALQELIGQVLENPTPGRTLELQNSIEGICHSSKLANIGASTLVVHGALDDHLDPENGRILARLIPNARLEEFAESGHLVPWEEPARTAALITAFLLSQDGA